MDFIMLVVMGDLVAFGILCCLALPIIFWLCREKESD